MGLFILQKRPILIPESLAYYSLGREDSFVYETSNGCALGGSLEEAIFHAILEAAERDSFCLPGTPGSHFGSWISALQKIRNYAS